MAEEKDISGLMGAPEGAHKLVMTDTRNTSREGAFSEPTCDDCSGRVETWFAPNEIWNAVMGGPYAKDDPGGYLCPTCFIVRAEAAGVEATGWELRPERTQSTPPVGEEEAYKDGLHEGRIHALTTRAEQAEEERDRRGELLEEISCWLVCFGPIIRTEDSVTETALDFHKRIEALKGDQT